MLAKLNLHQFTKECTQCVKTIENSEAPYQYENQPEDSFPGYHEVTAFFRLWSFSRRNTPFPRRHYSSALLALWFYGDFFCGIEDGLLFRRSRLIVIDFSYDFNAL